jgi:hypothetical protein
LWMQMEKERAEKFVEIAVRHGKPCWIEKEVTPNTRGNTILLDNHVSIETVRRNDGYDLGDGMTSDCMPHKSTGSWGKVWDEFYKEIGLPTFSAKELV